MTTTRSRSSSSTRARRGFSRSSWTRRACAPSGPRSACPPTHVAVVANAFTLRAINVTDRDSFLFSDNLVDEAKRLGWDTSVRGENVDFTRVFAGAEAGHKYASGRRMWMALSLLSALPADALPAEYGELVSDAPYPVSAPGRTNITIEDLFATMVTHERTH